MSGRDLAASEVRFSESFRQAYEAIVAASPLAVEHALLANQFEQYSFEHVVDGALRLQVELTHPCSKPGSASVVLSSYFAPEEAVKASILQQPEAAARFLRLFQDKVERGDLMRQAQVQQALADLPAMLRALKPFVPLKEEKRQYDDAPRTAAPQVSAEGKIWPPRDFAGRYRAESRDGEEGACTLDVWLMATGDGVRASHLPAVHAVGTLGKWHLTASRSFEEGMGRETVQLSCGVDRHGNAITETATGEVARNAVHILLAKVIGPVKLNSSEEQGPH